MSALAARLRLEQKDACTFHDFFVAERWSEVPHWFLGR
jgi:hypothetical protein